MDFHQNARRTVRSREQMANPIKSSTDNRLKGPHPVPRFPVSTKFGVFLLRRTKTNSFSFQQPIPTTKSPTAV